LTLDYFPPAHRAKKTQAFVETLGGKLRSSLIICAIGIALPFTPIGDALKFTPLPPLYWPIIACFSLIGTL
jgi:hypothetical protein